MSRVLLLITAIGVCLGTSIAELAACGDMVLRPGHGLRVRPYSPVHPHASILVYVPAGVSERDVKASRDFQVMLTARGKHPTQVAQGVDALRNALANSRYDLVIMRLTDAATVKDIAVNSLSRPDVVPFASDKATKLEVEAARRDYGHVLVPGSLEDILERLDHVMEPRRRASTAPLSR